MEGNSLIKSEPEWSPQTDDLTDIETNEVLPTDFLLVESADKREDESKAVKEELKIQDNTDLSGDIKTEECPSPRFIPWIKTETASSDLKECYSQCMEWPIPRKDYQIVTLGCAKPFCQSHRAMDGADLTGDIQTEGCLRPEFVPCIKIEPTSSDFKEDMNEEMQHEESDASRENFNKLVCSDTSDPVGRKIYTTGNTGGHYASTSSGRCLQKQPICYKVEKTLTSDTCATSTIQPANPKEDSPIHSSIKDRVPTHTSRTMHPCDVCKRSFTRKCHLKTHMVIHSGEKPYSCGICEARFAQERYLKKHMLTHTGEKPHSCSVCQARFAVRGSLRRHMLTHGGEKPYSCSVCQAKFNETGTLKKHMFTHTGQKPYLCSICAARFAARESLKRHMLTHSGEKPHSCSICEARFADSGTLNRHMLTHSGIKPHSCSICPAKFTERQTLKTHMLTHSGERPYECSICHAKFTWRGNWKTHMLTHSGERPYACSICEAKFKRREHLKSHTLLHSAKKLQ